MIASVQLQYSCMYYRYTPYGWPHLADTGDRVWTLLLDTLYL